MYKIFTLNIHNSNQGPLMDRTEQNMLSENEEKNGEQI